MVLLPAAEAYQRAAHRPRLPTVSTPLALDVLEDPSLNQGPKPKAPHPGSKSARAAQGRRRTTPVAPASSPRASSPASVPAGGSMDRFLTFTGSARERQVDPDANADTLKLASIHFDAARVVAQDGSWRSQNLVRQQRSPRLKAIEARSASGGATESFATLVGKSDDELVGMLIDNEVSTGTFVEYLRSRDEGSPTRLLPWLQTLAGLAQKIGLLLESTRYLACDLQLARILTHIQTSAKALTGGKRALAFLVAADADELLRIGARGEVLPGDTECLSRGTSFAAHCARAAKPIVVGLPGTPQRAALHFNVDSGTGCRPEASLLVPCLDHLGHVLAVIQVRTVRGARPGGGSSEEERAYTREERAKEGRARARATLARCEDVCGKGRRAGRQEPWRAAPASPPKLTDGGARGCWDLSRAGDR